MTVSIRLLPTIEDDGPEIIVVGSVAVSDLSVAYGTISRANDYFATRLHSELWEAESPLNKSKAIKTATRLIDHLNFVGEKHEAWLIRDALNVTCPTDTQLTAIWDAGETQYLEFPRGEDIYIPRDIELACYDLAFALLDGVDPEIEFVNQSTIAEGFANVRDTKDRSFVQEHIHAGIPSLGAWSRLRRYLRGARGLKLNRV